MPHPRGGPFGQGPVARPLSVPRPLRAWAPGRPADRGQVGGEGERGLRTLWPEGMWGRGQHGSLSSLPSVLR